MRINKGELNLQAIRAHKAEYKEAKMKDDGGPAFPQQHPLGLDFINIQGMSLRDWFAGMALQGIKWQGYERLDNSAQVCYALADAMLAERNR